MGFLKCEAGTTGDAIANMILTQLEEWQLEPQLLRVKHTMGQEQWLA